jgi:hypothetical protein
VLRAPFDDKDFILEPERPLLLRAVDLLSRGAWHCSGTESSYLVADEGFSHAIRQRVWRAFQIAECEPSPAA